MLSLERQHSPPTSVAMSSQLHDIQRSIAAVQHQLKEFDRRLLALQVSSTYTGATFTHSAHRGGAPTPTTFLPAQSPNSHPWLRETFRLLPNALAKSTVRGYDSTVQRFLKFCSDHGIPHQLQFPTHESVLCAFAASFAYRASGGSLANTMAALKTWHALHNATWQGGQRLVYVIKAVANCAPATATHPSRPGVTLDHLRILHENLDLRLPRDAAIYAIACIAFWGMCRLGELLGTSRRSHDTQRHPSRCSVTGTPCIGHPIDLHLPSTKTSQREGATIRLLAQHGRADPIYALANHFHVNRTPGPTDHLFAYQSTTLGPAKCITKEEFLLRCNQIWQANGKDRLSGHNFRIGGANHFLDRRVSSDVVKSMGRWKSGAFYKYWRKPEDKAVRFAQRVTEPPRACMPLAHNISGRLALPVHVA